MNFSQISETLIDERCGLFFLAGLDTRRPLKRAVLTVHAAQGTLTFEHTRFIETAVATLDPGIEVRIRLHSTQDLYVPDCLESFAERFRHDHIVSDPTGAFVRVSNLLQLSREIRAEVGKSVARLLWRADTSALIIVKAPLASGRSSPTRPDDVDILSGRVKSLVENRGCPDLKRAIKSVQVTNSAPSSRYTPIDASSTAPSGERSLTAVLARISGIVALIGLGALSAAHARTPANIDDAQFLMPGITGLVGLTTLGENSYGLRNRFQAVGGLRLYFGPSEILMASIFAPTAICADDCLVQEEPQEEQAPESSEPVWPMPSRVQYGT
ncbi:hypothetical protein GN330_04750 [Nitratireductor sp. CAU 1489]|uniref:Uncharacterized protein n=1 Tax=Nitratireductor arenosus TaxID=2682096 RepID=A0A844QC53_9HYPH|nr:hypothetical protein [Nitratireductor arenosus]MVA96557.1 hypothetical protein [Nitratireductor arenosus]